MLNPLVSVGAQAVVNVNRAQLNRWLTLAPAYQPVQQDG
jgi:hypothetical protein